MVKDLFDYIQFRELKQARMRSTWEYPHNRGVGVSLELVEIKKGHLFVNDEGSGVETLRLAKKASEKVESASISYLGWDNWETYHLVCKYKVIEAMWAV